jgi:hypothetical protein
MNKYFKISLLIFVFISIISLFSVNKNIIIKREKEPMYVAGIVNHHLLAEDIINKFFDELAKFEYDNIVVLSPDHFNICSVYGKSFIFEEDSQTAINKEHGIGNLLPMIKLS